MALTHFFLEDQIIEHEAGEHFALRLAPDDVKHARVLRLSPGERFAVIDAAQEYFECEIIAFDFDTMKVCIAQQIEVPIRPTVVLVQGVAKGEKMDRIIRQATELGVSGVVPFLCERSIVKLDAAKASTRVARWRTIAKSAAMQSGQCAVPEISHPATLTEVCAFTANAHAVLICWEEERAASVREVLQDALASQKMPTKDARVIVVVGPEGGFTQQEVLAMRGANKYAATVSLGSSILRTETAGIVAPALVLYELGELR